MSFGELNNIRLFSYRDSSHGRRCVARPGPPDSTAPLGTGTLYLGARRRGSAPICLRGDSDSRHTSRTPRRVTNSDNPRRLPEDLPRRAGHKGMGGSPPAPTRSWTTGPGVSRVRERETAPGTCRRMPRPVDLCHECYLPALKARHLM